MNHRDFEEKLTRRTLAAGVTAGSDVLARLEEYFQLLTVWNEKINLTGLDLRSDEALDRLLVEPLAAAPHVESGTRWLIDIGSGGGSPAIPLALLLPGTNVRMVEARTRKCVFLREALRATGLADRGEAIAARAEELALRPSLVASHDLLTMRGVRIDRQLLERVQPLVRAAGELFLFRSAGSSQTPDLPAASLEWKGTHRLLDNLKSELIVLRKPIA